MYTSLVRYKQATTIDVRLAEEDGNSVVLHLDDDLMISMSMDEAKELATKILNALPARGWAGKPLPKPSAPHVYVEKGLGLGEGKKGGTTSP